VTFSVPNLSTFFLHEIIDSIKYDDGVELPNEHSENQTFESDKYGWVSKMVKMGGGGVSTKNAAVAVAVATAVSVL
jgi:hypothetical protein